MYSNQPAPSALENMFSGMFSLWGLVFYALVVVAMWKVFVKAGQPGWASIIPFYNSYILLKIVNRPAWWLLLFFIPIVNIVVTVILSIDLAKAFGKTPVFGVVGLFLFSIIGYMILGFGDAKYTAPPARA